MARFYSAFLLLSLLLTSSLSAQNRDVNAERIVIDDAAGDGGWNTLTANQILFGNGSGQIAQSGSLMWDNGIR